jgi:hypothetical protein
VGVTRSPLAAGEAPGSSLALFEDESYFLSGVNPTATRDQREIERLALELLDSPLIKQAREEAAGRFKVFGSAAPAEAWDGFEDRMTEWTYHYLTLALNSDPNHPRVLGHGYGPPHSWFGHAVPGGRGPGTGENPDNHYSFVPIDGCSRFELHVKLSDPPVADCPIWVCTNLSQSMNVSGLDWRDVRIEDDGTFVITIDPEPPNGRPHHLQTTIDSKHVLIRDGRQHWDQKPNAYRIARLDPPDRAPLSHEEQTALAYRYIVDNAASNFGFTELVAALEPNTITEPAVSTGFGGMPSQTLARGRLDLADDEAYVLTVSGKDSEYWLLTVYDWWLMSGDWWGRTSSLNDSQSVANPDGSYTYVFSSRDPGVHNWMDTLGRRECLFLARWQLLPQTDVHRSDTSWANGEVVKHSQLREVLPAETTWVTPKEREQQLADRLASFERRYIT